MVRAATGRFLRTLRLIGYALLPSAGGRGEPTERGEVRRIEPRGIRGGMGRYLDGAGELRLFFPDCLAAAAPFILFRLKREGFSRCRAHASERGLLVEARR